MHLNLKSNDRLTDIISREPWHEHFTLLTQTLGFSLKVYSDAGVLLHSSPGKDILCSPLAGSAAFRRECEKTCMTIVADVLRNGERRLFTCAAHIVSFAIPIEQAGERAVILGHGSFASYRDYLVYADLMRTYAPDAPLPMTSMLRYTTHHDAWSASFVAGRSINLLLESVQKNIALQKKMVNIQEVIGWWGTPGEQDETALYQRLLRSLKDLYDIKQASVSVRVLPMNAYQPLSPDASSISGAGVTLANDDAVIRELRSAKPFVRGDGRSFGPRQGPDGSETWFFFPLWVRKELEAVLTVACKTLPDNDVQIVAALCRQTALVIENRRLQADLFSKFNRLASIAELTKEIYAIRNYDHLLRSIIDKSAELLMAEQGSLLLLDRDADALLLAARKGNRLAGDVKIPTGEGIAGKVAVQGEPLLVENVELDPRTLQKNREHYRTPSFISVPLKIGDHIIGVLNFADKITGEVFDQEDLQLILSFATHAALVLERNDLYLQAEQLRSLSSTDALTGVLNRRAFQARFDEEVIRAKRHGRDLSLLMMDIDGFKTINDRYGHREGDRAIKMVTSSLMKAVRSIDIIARYGGDEFVVILPDAGSEIALLVGERIRREVEGQRPPWQESDDKPAPHITVSIGVANGSREGETAETLLEKADRGLYKAKSLGRNRVEAD